MPVEATQIPLPELFFAGGSNSLRSFSINQAGPRDPADGLRDRRAGTVRQQPGDSHAAGVAAVRRQQPGFRLLPRHGQRLRHGQPHHQRHAALPSAVDCAVRAAEQQDAVQLQLQLAGLGMGIRYKTPVGPVRFDLGYAFNPTRYPVQETGQTFRCGASTYFSVLDKLSNETSFAFRELCFVAAADSSCAGIRRGSDRRHSGHASTASRFCAAIGTRLSAFEAFMQQKPLDQVTEADRVLALQHLIDRQLLKAQMGDASYMQPNGRRAAAGRRQSSRAGAERQ